MARVKGTVLDTRASPPPAALPEVSAAIAPSDPDHDSISTSALEAPVTTVAEKKICPFCNTGMANFPIKEARSHVNNCPGIPDGIFEPISPLSTSLSSSLTSPPESPSVGRATILPTQEHNPVNDTPKDDAPKGDAPKDLVSDEKPLPDQTDAGNQVESEDDVESDSDSDSDDSDVGEVGNVTATISAYCQNEKVFYESEEEEDASAVEAVSRPSSVKSSRQNSAKNSARSSAKSSAKSSAAPTPEVEDPQSTSVPNDPQSVQASQSSNKSRNSQPLTDTDEPQPSQVSEVPDVLVIESFTNSKTPKTWKGILKNPKPQGHKHERSGSISKSARSGSMSKSVRSGSIPKSVRSGSISRSARSGSVPQITPMRPKKKKKLPGKLGFPKLTAIEDFETYLAKPEEMSYAELYRKTAFVAQAMTELQAEFDFLDKKTDDYEAAKKHQAKMTAEAKKEQDDKEAAETDAILLQLHAQYREEVKQPLKDYNIWLDQLQAASNPETTPPGYWDYMKQIKNPEVMSKVHKRRRQLEKQEAKPTSLLEDTPLPALRKGDEEVRKKRNLLQDPVVFEDRKTADVYMADYSKHKDAIGNQVLKDRRAVVAVEEKDENGRPKRSRGKRAYDTEQTNTPGGSDSEEAPLGKRRRTARVVQDLPTSPARRRTATREGSPKVSVFPKSGKRIGRPPKSRGDVLPPVPKSASKSKLQQSHLPPVSEPALSTESDDDLDGAKTPRELEPNEEAQLQQAAEALVQQTQSANAAPAKPKHAGGRPRKAALILNVRSDDETPEVKAGPKKAGRPPAKPKAARGGRPKKEVEVPVEPVHLVEDNDVMQSTEQDDESRFASASTSRPTTSSSAMTTSTGRASRAASRAATRERSTQAAILGGPVGAQAPPAKSRGGKRKRIGVENGAPDLTQSTGPVPKKRKNYAKKQEAVPEEEDEEQPFTPEATGEMGAEGSTTASGRPKRTKASVLTDSIYVALPGDEDFAQDDESEPPPQKRRKGGKVGRPGRKSKAVKQEATESEYFSEAADEVQPQAKKHMIRFDNTRKVLVPEEYRSQDTFENYDHSKPPLKQSRASKGKGKELQIREYTYTSEDAGGNSSAANRSGTTPGDSEIPSGLQTGDDTDGLSINSRTFSKKGKGKASSYTPNLESGLSGAEQSGHDGDGEDGGSSVAQEEARKKAQKSRKLAEATRERWAKGLMKGPMEKRAATNAAKKAAKDAAKGGPSNGGVPASSFTPNPFFTAPPNPLLPMTFDNPPTFVAAPQNPFSNPAGNAPDMFASLDAIAYVGAPLPPTTFVPVTVGPSGPVPRKPKSVPAKKRKPAAPKSNTNSTNSPSSSQQTPAQTATTSNASASTQDTTASASTLLPAPTRGSTRVRKPSRLALGMDGADDDEEPQTQFRSEYERYQALTSPRSPLTLGKRKRKSLMDLSAMRDDDDDSF